MYFTRDISLVCRPTDEYRHEMYGFEPETWLADEDNLCLTDGRNISLFEKSIDGIYTGHYFFVDRGREALRIGREMIDFIFKETDVKVIRGLTPLTNLGARWMSRQLGFKSMGAIQTKSGPCELFIKIKEA